MSFFRHLPLLLLLIIPVSTAAVSLQDEMQALEAQHTQKGPRLLIKKIIVDGFKPYPEKDITLVNLQNIITKALNHHNNRLLLDDIYTITDYLTAAYSDAGLTFHQVTLPPQEVINHTIRIKVVEGVLGDISAFSDKQVDEQFLKSAYLPFYQKSIDQKEIEEATLLLNETPGLEVFSYYSRGIGPGESRLNVRVQDSEVWNGFMRFDNHGDDSTGEYRLLGSLIWHRPLMSADELTFSIMHSADPENNLYGTVSYRMPVIGYRTFLGFLISNNEFDLGGDFTALEANGTSTNVQLDLFYKHARGSNFNQDFSLYVNSKNSDLKNTLNNTLLTQDQESQGLGLTWSVNNISQNKFLKNNLFLNLYSGKYDKGFSTLDGESFIKSNLAYDLNWQLSNPTSFSFSDLHFKFAGQASSDRLPAYERNLLTGPYAVRAYDSSVSSADKALVASIEFTLLSSNWLGNHAFSRYTKPYIFYDIAFGELNTNVAGSTTEFDVAGFGFGLFYRLHKQLTGNISASKGLMLEYDGIEQNLDETRVFFDMVYRFK